MIKARVIERSRLSRAGEGETVAVSEDGWVDTINPRLFARLRRLDSARGGDALFDWGAGNYARAGSTVGVLACPGLVVEILPKVGSSSKGADIRANLLYMLQKAGLVESLNPNVASLDARKAPMSDVLIRSFADRLTAELQRGVQRDYVPCEGNRNIVRGRIVHSRNIALNAARPDRVYCRFDRFEHDHRLNRLFRATCQFLLRQGCSAGTETSLRNAVAMLDEVSDVPLSRKLADSIVLDRRQNRFGPLHDFCRMVADGLSTDPRSGEYQSYSMLFDMDRVFEAFLARFLQGHVLPEINKSRQPDAQLTITTQGRGDRVYLLHDTNAQGRLPMKPDILIRVPNGLGQSTTVVIDTKWKRGYKEDKKRDNVSNADLYQVYAYAREFEATTTTLLYPQIEGFGDRDYTLKASNGGMPQHVYIRSVAMNHDLTKPAGRADLKQELVKLISALCRLGEVADIATHNEDSP